MQRFFLPSWCLFQVLPSNPRAKLCQNLTFVHQWIVTALISCQSGSRNGKKINHAKPTALDFLFSPLASSCNLHFTYERSSSFTNAKMSFFCPLETYGSCGQKANPATTFSVSIQHFCSTSVLRKTPPPSRAPFNSTTSKKR